MRDGNLENTTKESIYMVSLCAYVMFDGTGKGLSGGYRPDFLRHPTNVSVSFTCKTHSCFI